MKNKSIITLFIGLLGLGVSTTSCEDMLTPDMDRYVTGFNGKDTVNFYLGILRNLQGVAEQNVLLGEIRGDLTTTTSYSSDSIGDIANFNSSEDGDSRLLNRAAYYKVINQCNFYLAVVDTLAKKNDIYYMRKEAAQVAAIRAWTYLQLVQNYGEVPFITQPVDNADTGWETNSPEGNINFDNILAKLEKDLELSIYYEDTEGFPNYGTFNSGSGANYAHRNLIFPSRLVLADIYLAAAKTKNDYEKAAQYYYEYLTKSRSSIPDVASNKHAAQFDIEEKGNDFVSTPYPAFWMDHMFATRAFGEQLASTEAITVIPSAANSSFGQVLTTVAQVYGFDSSSYNYTNGTTGSDGSESATTSGQITISANYKVRQVQPSTRYEAINAAQLYTYDAGAGDVHIVKYPNVGDARLAGSAPLVVTDEGRMRFIHKFGIATYVNSGGETYLYNFSFRYGIPVYRVSQVYLRYAEALNRAGHPRYAFAVLRNGLSKLPSVYKEDTLNSVKTPRMTEKLDDNGDVVLNDDGTPVMVPAVGKDGKPIYDVVSCNVAVRMQFEDGYNNFITYDADSLAQLKKLYMGFVDQKGDASKWKNAAVYGIHAYGGGSLIDKDTLYNYGAVVAKRMLEEELRKNGVNMSAEDMKLAFYKPNGLELDTAKIKDYDLPEALKEHIVSLYAENYTDQTRLPFVLYEGVVGENQKITRGNRISPYQDEALLQYEINAVETLLADEMALETAFEGYRYYDLMRIARHKLNDANYPGIEWFAWIIARRNMPYAPYENVGMKDDALYSKLQTISNWYLPNPQY